MRRGALVALLVAALCSIAPAQTLPPPLPKGGSGTLLVPAGTTDNLAVHLRGTLLFGSYEDVPMRLLWQGGLSVSLWRWAEMGATFSGRWARLGAHEMGPIELWARVGPPSVRGVSAQLFVEQAAAPASFDFAGTLWRDTTTLGGALGLQKSRLDLSLSAAYQTGTSPERPRYQGAQLGAGAWLTVLRDALVYDIQLGGEVLYRVGGTAGAGGMDAGLVFAVGLRFADEHGAAFAGGYGQGWGAGLPSRFGVIRAGHSFGPDYRLPPASSEPLFTLAQRWLDERWQRYREGRLAPPPVVAPPALAVPAARPPAMPVRPSYCTPPPLSYHALRACTAAPFSVEPDHGRVLSETIVRAHNAPPSGEGESGHPTPGPAFGPQAPPRAGTGPAGIAAPRPPGPPRSGPRGMPRTGWRTGRGTGTEDDPAAMPPTYWTTGRPPGSASVRTEGQPAPPPAIPVEDIRPEVPPSMRPADLPPALRPPPPPPRAQAPQAPAAAPRQTEAQPPRRGSARAAAIDAVLPKPAPPKQGEGQLFGKPVRRLAKELARGTPDLPECEECGVRTPTPHVDHIQARSKGGSGRITNAEILCPECDRAKSNKPTVPWVKNPVDPRMPFAPKKR